MRSIHAIRLGQAQAGGWDPRQKVRRREKSTQTVGVGRGEERKDEETYGFVYEMDQDLLRSEK